MAKCISVLLPETVLYFIFINTEASLSSSSLARQPFVSNGLPQNYSPFFPIAALSFDF
jgi:hypothetical protein